MAGFLTKSRFKLALECPTKLFYAANEQLYKNAKHEDSFLQSLAEGGFQVGAMAAKLYPTGKHITAVQAEVAVEHTKAALSGAADSILFEAAVQSDRLFARIDILTKVGNNVELIEVKAKSYNSLKPDIEGTKVFIKSSMLPYLQDIAFQKFVFSRAYPELKVSCFLMMPDKAVAAVDSGLNQLFKIERGKERIKVIIDPLADQIIPRNASLLAKVAVDQYVDHILVNQLLFPGGSGSIVDLTKHWSECYSSRHKIASRIHKACSKCEYRSKAQSPMRSGFHECFEEQAGLSRNEIDKGTVLDLWNFRGKDKILQKKKFKLSDVTKEDLKVVSSSDYLTNSERQYMQCVGTGDSKYSKLGFYLHTDYIKKEFSKWKFPLHLIDFETSTTALPFFSGMRPFESVAFQFSHHAIDSDGAVRHAGQYLNVLPGVFPNVDFLRALKKELSFDNGTIFRWGDHENTILNHIKEQLQHSSEPPDDLSELLEFISSITREGDRSMVDLNEMARCCYFHTSTKGRTSIKKVLPAVLSTSEFLKEKYRKPIYGNEIASLNFKDVSWFEEKDGNIIDPYQRLKSLKTDLLGVAVDEVDDNEDVDSDELDVADGGAALTAFARLQFENLSPESRKRIESSLLRYCELDTLAMVMIVEAWLDWTGIKLK